MSPDPREPKARRERSDRSRAGAALPGPGPEGPAFLDALLVDELDVESLAKGRIHRLGILLATDGLGKPIYIPALVARGAAAGPVFGITSAVHGNELNGVPIIHQLFRSLDCEALRGTVVGCPVVNIPGYLANERTLREGKDLNRLMPGRPDGHTGEVYAHRLLTRLVEKLNYLIDLHTASFGRVNSLYVRANMLHPVAATMARLQGPEIIVHNEATEGTVRAAAMAHDIPAITVEVGNPLRFQRNLIRDSLIGIKNVLAHLEMIEEDYVPPVDAPVICKRSYWIYSQHGGFLEVFPDVATHVRRGRALASVTSIFGDLVAEYGAPEDAVIVGRSTNPLCETGSRVVHLGVIGNPVPHARA